MSLDQSTIVSYVALAVSLVALLATCMQVLQQYYASATGYSQCNEKVMGGWALTKTRRFSWDELRYEVQYDAPVIFVSPPQNKRGPIPDAPIYFLDGTPKSLKDTWTNPDSNPRSEYLKLSVKERVHTADNERVSWLLLLEAVQRMEAKSCEWQQKQYGPPGRLASQYGLPTEPPSLQNHHTLTVALQRKRKSWDTMPKNMTKPYATTTMCHLIEMLAALGIYWQEFDRRRDRYRAEGNGFLVLGQRVEDLGIVFSLQIHGQSAFERNRVIPVDYIKELTFGYVPTIYRDTIDQSRLRVPSDMPENLSSLQMSNDREIAESLTVIGCNTNTVNYLLEGGKRTSHIFPLAFEILGMLSQNFHINHSSFTYIPNPTAESFDKRSFSLYKVMEAFQGHFAEESYTTRNPVIVDSINHHIGEILAHYSEKDGVDRLLFLQVLHMAIDDTDEILTAKRKDTEEENPESPVESRTVVPVVVSSEEEGETTFQSQRREAVQDVLRSHIQEVMRLLNERDERGADGQSLGVYAADRATPASPVPAARPSLQTRFNERGVARPVQPPPSFEDVDDASPDERQQLYMDVYFGVIRRRVVQKAALSTDRRASLVGGRTSSLPSLRGERNLSRGRSLAPRPGSSRAGSSLGPSVGGRASVALSDGESEADVAVMSDAGDEEDENGATAVNATLDRRARNKIPLSAHLASHEDIWCTLVFRMICWLMLHDFNKLDVQVSKSELLGSRVPVYIS